MSDSLADAMKRLHGDRTLEHIEVNAEQHTDAELAELVDCLLAHPDVVTTVSLALNQLTDETGVKLARYLAASSTITRLDLSYNRFGPATYLALAAALRVNSSLRVLYLYSRQAVDEALIDAAFVEALQRNPRRPAESLWFLYTSDQNDFKRLQHAASS